MMLSEAWLRLLQAATPGTRAWPTALRALGSAEALLGASDARLAEAGLEYGAAARLAARRDPRTEARWRRWLEGPGRGLLTLDRPGYPSLLAQLPDAPLALWAEGRVELAGAAQLAIVGTRSPSLGGRRTAEEFARYLGERGLAVTSGLAAGIDAAAHRGALEGGAGTVTVFGCGPDTVYPALNRELAAAIVEQGLVVSEYGPGTPVRPYQFPRRNRIIAGLSLGTLVVEATRHSGSLITAGAAADQGREVFAIPGSIHHPLARGCHALLRQGAKLVEEGADILVELAPLIQLETPPEAARISPVDDTEPADPAYANLLKLLGFNPAGIDELAAATGLTPAELSSMLLVLELEGLVEALPGARYMRLAKRS